MLTIEEIKAFTKAKWSNNTDFDPNSCCVDVDEIEYNHESAFTNELETWVKLGKPDLNEYFKNHKS